MSEVRRPESDSKPDPPGRARAPSPSALAEGPTLESRERVRPAPLVADAPPGETLDTSLRSRDAGAIRPGARIGRYTVLSKLGEGGMGEVFSAYDAELERRVAIKVLRPRENADPTHHARMLREAQALARLSHPNVVQIHDVGAIDGQVFVAMEFLKGVTLRAWQEAQDPTSEAGRRAILAMYAQAGAGLAAAHASGLIHRDFKPDNVLVCDDGRARVLDFGLAAGLPAIEARGGADELEQTLLVSLLDSDLTRTGSIMGTPAYMAPEQFLAQPTDARTDVFAFSVALWEALYGALPFAGETFAARQAAVVAGAIEAAPTRAAIPAWLRGVVLRGLAREPADRFVDVDALLAALADDPIARRRRRLRLFGLLCGVTALVAGLIVGGLALASRVRAARSEAMAEERRAAVERRIDALTADGADEEAERAFAAFVTNPDNRGSVALARAWLSRAERARSTQAIDRSLDAYARAYTLAAGAEEQIAALVGLAELAREDLRARALVFAVAAVAERFPALRGRADINDLEVDAALARADLDEAASLLRGALPGSRGASVRPVIEALRGAHQTPYSECGITARALPRRDDEAAALIFGCSVDRSAGPSEDARERPSILVRADPELTRIATMAPRVESLRVLGPGPDGRILVIQIDDPSGPNQEPHAVLYALEGATLEPLFRWPEESIRATLIADVDGDGAPNYLVGSGPYTRRVRELVADPSGAWSISSPAPAIDRRRSDVIDLLAGDLDGDGEPEVVAALGAWIAYELEVLRYRRESGTLEPIARRRLGNLIGAALVRPGGGAPPEIVAIKDDDNPNSILFPAAHPLGDPAGVYFFRFGDDAIDETAFLPAPPSRPPLFFNDTPPLVGDLDGDGVDEVIFSRRRALRSGSVAIPVLVILVRGDDDTWHTLHLNEAWPLAVLDLDGDGDDELVITLEEGRELWVLGSGDERLPPPVRGRSAAAEPPADPALARMWRHADDLAQMDLLRQAAGAFATIADLALTREDRGRAHFLAGALSEEIPDDSAAASLFAQAAAAGHPSASVAAARSFLRLGAVDRAAAALGPIDGRSAATPADAEAGATLRAALAEFTRAPTLEFRFDRPLDRSWRIAQPLALRRGPDRLEIDAIVGGELMSAPVRWDGSILSLEIDIDPQRLEWAGGLEIAVKPEGEGPSPLQIEITHSGGGSLRNHEIGCLAFSHRKMWIHPVDDLDNDHLGRVRVRVTLLPELSEWTCEVADEDGSVLAHHRNTIPQERLRSAITSDYRLVVASDGDPLAWVEADLRRLTLTGAAPRPTPAAIDDSSEAPAQRAGRLLVERDPVGALQAIAEATEAGPALRLLGVVARARLGRWEAAEAELGALLGDEASAAAITPTLRALLRTEPAVYGPLIGGVAGRRVYQQLLGEAWSLAFTMELDDPETLTTLWDGLVDYDLEDGRYDLLKIRGFVARRLGHRGAAEASYVAALAALDDPDRAGVLTRRSADEIASIRFDWAASAVDEGDLERARGVLRPLFAVDDPDPYLIDRLRAREDLRALCDASMCREGARSP